MAMDSWKGKAMLKGHWDTANHQKRLIYVFHDELGLI